MQLWDPKIRGEGGKDTRRRSSRLHSQAVIDTHLYHENNAQGKLAYEG
jgi:hypothetical protein